MVEESPSTAVNEDIRKRMGEAAARLVATSKYTNAGTLEFLLDARGDFYFMEVNTRLQVEHPVTEMVSGIDLVEQQLKIAYGEKLEIQQEDIVPKGHAIECRICAEDVFNDFLPETGIVRYVEMPTGDGIRNDSGLYAGYEVSVNYDSMVAKLICWGESREQAISKTAFALDNYHIAGLRTTIPFCRDVMDSQAFAEGKYSTKYIDEHWDPSVVQKNTTVVAAAATFGALSVKERRKPIVQIL